MQSTLKKIAATQAQTTEAELRAMEAQYCSYGDTVHYLEHPKFFDHADGSFIYDMEGREFLPT